MSYCVYKHTFPNGKVYIGITGQKPERRWKNGYGYLKKNKDGEYTQALIAKAILKYGWDNITHEIMFDGLNKDEAELKEIELISLYQSNKREFGYNIANGGNTNGKHSEETRKKISEANKGERHVFFGKPCSEERKRNISKAKKGNVHHSKETRKKMSDAKKGKYCGINNHFYGKRHSDDTRKKMKENHADMSGENNSFYGKTHSEETKKIIGIKNGRPVRCLETNTVYHSASEAGREMNINRTCIQNVCNNIQKTAGGVSLGVC